MTEKISELSKRTFTQMGLLSQITIDLVEDAETIFLDDENEIAVEYGALSYTIHNILEIIDPTKKEDIEILTELDNEIEKIIDGIRNTHNDIKQ
jgi:CRISPR/Cas system-associated exonuclease Cas4 (RecB family)